MTDLTAIDRLLGARPFDLNAACKRELFAAAMREAFAHHCAGSATFRKYCDTLGFSPDHPVSGLASYPYLPASLFKRADLVSVPPGEIENVIRSSGTTGASSSIAVDRTTARRQALASARIIASYLGERRRPFLMLDEDPAPGRSAGIPARSAATRGFLTFASRVEYFAASRLDGAAVLDVDRLAERLGVCEASGEEVCVFGLTYVLHHDAVSELARRGRRFHLSPQSSVAHIGGWKRLAERSVSPRRFLDDVRAVVGVKPGRVFDFYGFTEQMGLVYGSAGLGPKTVPACAEVIVRDPDTLQPAPDGTAGLIQVLTPLPHSYPGISVLTEDVGRIVGRDRDEAGRIGTQFEVLGRAARSEPRGCGDVDGAGSEADANR